MEQPRERFAPEDDRGTPGNRREALRENWPGIAFAVLMPLFLLGGAIWLAISFPR